VSDAYNGAKLTMVVADSCGDSNAWCRDDRYHLDLSRPSLNRFVQDGTPVGDLDPGHWNNRRVSWQFVPAPNYAGDIRIGFLQGAQVWWGAIAISQLPNGIHGVEYFANGTWQQAQMNSDMGQSYIISGLTTASRDFRIRVRDAADQPLFGGRVYDFALPSSCPSSCGAAYTQVPYTVTST
jgi:expansin (peptidoglycan-binding protein)